MVHCSIDPPPSSVVQADISSSTVAKQALMPAGMFMGDSMFPLPERKILNLEYIEMTDLCPEA